MSASYENDYTLDAFDRENWWNFLAEKYPENHKLALRYYYKNEDEILAMEGVKPKNFYINDYFTIYGLPRISATKGVIRVNGIVKKRYGGYGRWMQKRAEFDKLKQEKLFKRWKREQYKCQDGKCAWCKKHIKLSDEETHVDHVVPLIYDGDNEFKNLVLTCAECNINKGSKTEGFNSGMYSKVRNSTPSWIKRNCYNSQKLPQLV